MYFQIYFSFFHIMQFFLYFSLESNPELDALSRMVVDKVLEKIKSDPKGIPAKIGKCVNLTKFLIFWNYFSFFWVIYIFFSGHGPANGEEKSGMAVTQMRYLLQRERNLVSELQVIYLLLLTLKIFLFRIIKHFNLCDKYF